MKRLIGLAASVAMLGSVGCAHNKAEEKQAENATYEQQQGMGGSGAAEASKVCPPKEAKKKVCPPKDEGTGGAGLIQSEDVPGSEKPAEQHLDDGTGGAGGGGGG